MGQFIIDYGDNGLLIVDAFCLAYGYQATLPDPETGPGATKPNPESRADFTRRLIKLHIRNVLRDYKKRLTMVDFELVADTFADDEAVDIIVN